MNDPGSPSSPALYADRSSHYFAGARTQFVDELPEAPAARILEIGCGNGDTGALALARGKCGFVCGVELCDEPAAVARGKMSQVLVGDVEKIELPFAPHHFDALLMSEVIEHLVDPWTVLRKLHPLLRPGGIVIAGSPNVAHNRILRMLLRGEWLYEDAGPLDKTHLRWFTPKSYRRLFEECGFVVEKVVPGGPFGAKGRLFDALTMGRAQHLLMPQIVLKARRG